MKLMRRCCLILAFLGALPLAALAQTQGGSIEGTVTDPNGAVVPSATVVATDTRTGVKNTVQTSQGGVYVFPLLLPDPYTITVTQTGFKSVVREGIEVRLALTDTIDVKLELGAVQQRVEVQGAAPVLTTNNATVGVNMSPQTLDTLPVWFGGSMRLANSFMGYMPGVQTNDQTTIMGSVGRATEVMIDGGSIISPESGGISFYFPGMEPYSETRVITSGATADLGRTGGGYELFTTKSGTNLVHGSMFYNFERQIFNANSWSGNQNTTPGNFSCFGHVQTYACRPKVRYNDEGGSAGGPVYIPHVYDGRNRTFWFFTWEGYWQPATVAQNLGEGVATAQEIQGNFQGVYGATSPVLYDPLTTSGGVRQPFGTAGAYNVIPSNRISNISKNFTQYIPPPNSGTGSGITGNYYFNQTTVVTDKDWSIKIDHSWGTKNHVSFFETHRYEPSNVVQYLPGPISDGLLSTTDPHQFRGAWDWVAKPHVILHSMFSLDLDNQSWYNPLQNGYGCKLGFTELACGTQSDATPIVTFTGGTNTYTNWGMNQGKVNMGGQRNHIVMYGQNLTWTRNKHEFKMGWEIRRSATLANDFAGTNGTYNFSNFQTQYAPSLPTCTADPAHCGAVGDSFASFLLGMPNSASQVGLPNIPANIRYAYNAGYLMDSWKILPNLTFTLGIRYEVPINWHYVNGADSSFSPTVPNLQAGSLPGGMIFMGQGVGHTGTLRPYPTDFTDIGPRLGFAWHTTPNTVIRGAFGLIYEGEGNGNCGCTDGFGGGTFSQTGDGFDSALALNGTQYTWDKNSSGGPGVNPPQGFVAAQQIPGIDNFGSGGPIYMGPKWGYAPRIYDMNLTVQRQYKGWLFQLGYEGQRTHNAISADVMNALPASDLSLMSTATAQTVNGTVIPAGTNLLSWSFNNATQGPLLNAMGYYSPSGVGSKYAPYGSGVSGAQSCPGWTTCWTSGWGSASTLFQALRPFPQMGTVYYTNGGNGWISYDSMVLQVEHRFGDLNFESSYVWSKNLDIDSGMQIFGLYHGVQANQDPNNRPDNKTFANADYPNMVNFTLSYNLPFGRGKKFLGSSNGIVNKLVGGWTLAGVGQYRSGALILISSPTTNLQQYMGWEVTKADFTGATIKTNIATNTLDPDNPNTRWFTTTGTGTSASFIQAPAGTEGNNALYNNHFRQPWFRDERISVNKLVAIWGEGKVSLRYSLFVYDPFQRTDFGGITGGITSTNFGRPTGGAEGPRQISMGLRLYF